MVHQAENPWAPRRYDYRVTILTEHQHYEPTLPWKEASKSQLRYWLTIMTKHQLKKPFGQQWAQEWNRLGRIPEHLKCTATSSYRSLLWPNINTTPKFVGKKAFSYRMGCSFHRMGTRAQFKIPEHPKVSAIVSKHQHFAWKFAWVREMNTHKKRLSRQCEDLLSNNTFRQGDHQQTSCLFSQSVVCVIQTKVNILLSQ